MDPSSSDPVYLSKMSAAVYASMKAADPNAVWCDTVESEHSSHITVTLTCFFLQANAGLVIPLGLLESG